MELYRVESLTFTYPGQFVPALRDGFPAAAKARSSAS